MIIAIEGMDGSGKSSISKTKALFFGFGNLLAIKRGK